MLQTATLVALAVVAVSVLTVGLSRPCRIFFAVRRPAARLLEADVDAGSELRTGFSFPSLWLWPMVLVEMRWVRPVDAVFGAGGPPAGRVTPTRGAGMPPSPPGSPSATSSGWRPCGSPAGPRPPARGPGAGVARSCAVRHASGEGPPTRPGHEEGDRVEMRRYAPGSAPHDLWKVYADLAGCSCGCPSGPSPRSPAPWPASWRAARTSPPPRQPGCSSRMACWGPTSPSWPTARAAAHSAEDAIEQVIGSADHRHRSGERLLTLPREHARAELTNCIIFVPGRAGARWLPPPGGPRPRAAPAAHHRAGGGLDAGRRRPRPRGPLPAAHARRRRHTARAARPVRASRPRWPSSSSTGRRARPWTQCASRR
ncbi:MAG: hypothetical protein R3F43_14245 [bacterium]